MNKSYQVKSGGNETFVMVTYTHDGKKTEAVESEPNTFLIILDKVKRELVNDLYGRKQ